MNIKLVHLGAQHVVVYQVRTFDKVGKEGPYRAVASVKCFQGVMKEVHQGLSCRTTFCGKLEAVEFATVVICSSSL